MIQLEEMNASQFITHIFENGVINVMNMTLGVSHVFKPSLSHCYLLYTLSTIDIVPTHQLYIREKTTYLNW